jgi:hypothetical protein
VYIDIIKIETATATAVNGATRMSPTSTTVVLQQGSLGTLKSRHHLTHSPSLSNGSSFLIPSTNGRIQPNISPRMPRSQPQTTTQNNAPESTRVFKFDNFSDQSSGRIVDLGITDDDLIFFSKTCEKVCLSCKLV